MKQKLFDLAANHSSKSPPKTKNVISTEMIDFQDKSKWDNLVKILREARTFVQQRDPIARNLSSKFSKRIAKEITKHTKLSVRLYIEEGEGAWTFPLYLNKRITLQNSGLRNWTENEEIDFGEEQEEFITEMADKKRIGTIDLKNATVGGVFTKYEHELHIGLSGLFKQGLTEGEIAAILLHEVGHMFTFLEFSNRTTSTNIALSEIAKKMNDKNNDKFAPKEYTYMLNDLIDDRVMPEEVVEDLNKSKNRVIFGWKLSKYVYDVHTTSLDMIKYDETSGEAVADNFASRQGFATELVTGLHKMYEESGAAETGGSLAYIKLQLFIFFSYLIFVASILGTVMPLSWLLYIAFSIMLFTSSTRDEDMTYDRLKQRHKRNYYAVVEKLKDSKLSAKEKKSMLEDLEVIDSLIGKTKNIGPMLQPLSNLLFFKNRSEKNYILFQQKLEELANNRLFISAAKVELLHSELTS